MKSKKERGQHKGVKRQSWKFKSNFIDNVREKFGVYMSPMGHRDVRVQMV